MRQIIGFALFAVAAAAAVPMLLDGRLTPDSAGPAQPVAQSQPAPTRPEQALSGRKVRLEADRSGHFRGEFRLNGRAVEALIDTGATVVAINSSTARRIGLSVQPSEFKYQVQTANGATKAAAVRIADLQIGRIRLDNVDAMVLDDRALKGALVGMSVLKRLSRYQVEGQTLVLEQ
ncbi:MAG: TIGR02281 family clan AA aspartic protease [Mesorhizobium sp.]